MTQLKRTPYVSINIFIIKVVGRFFDSSFSHQILPIYTKRGAAVISRQRKFLSGIEETSFVERYSVRRLSSENKRNGIEIK